MRRMYTRYQIWKTIIGNQCIKTYFEFNVGEKSRFAILVSDCVPVADWYGTIPTSTELNHSQLWRGKGLLSLN